MEEIEKQQLKKLLFHVLEEYFQANPIIVSKVFDGDFKEGKKLISLGEIATLFGVSLVTVYKWRRNGILPRTIKVGGRVFLDRKEVMEALNNNGR